ncbi:hypothetical protein V6Z11_D08G137100 [Gossypium hirsutum]
MLHLVYKMWNEMIEKVKTSIYRYYCRDWLNEVPNYLPPYKDVEISEEMNKCLRRFFPSTEERKMAFQEFARFLGALNVFG